MSRWVRGSFFGVVFLCLSGCDTGTTREEPHAECSISQSWYDGKCRDLCGSDAICSLTLCRFN